VNLCLRQSIADAYVHADARVQRIDDGSNEIMKEVIT
jgi:alkylation response protein AidB-like acyl-CoA dehydrogenase